jgi:hypothetical protein
LQALVEAGFDANIVTRNGIDKLKSGGYEPEVVPGGRPIQGPDGIIYTGSGIVTAHIYVTGIGRRSEDESFYLVDPDPSHLLCDLVLDPASRIARDLVENSAAPTYFRPRTDGESLLVGCHRGQEKLTRANSGENEAARGGGEEEEERREVQGRARKGSGAAEKRTRGEAS